MIVLGFTIVFHGPFRVGSAYARDGIDAALDRHDPLPPDHLKGLMRASAASLGVPAALLDGVFGSPAAPSPWAWNAAVPESRWEFSLRTRVAIDPAAGAARKDQLVLGEQAWTPQARFEITQAGALPDDSAATHVLILRCAASAMHGLGAWRRRGLGWVGVTPDAGPVSAAEAAELMALSGVPR